MSEILRITAAGDHFVLPDLITRAVTDELGQRRVEVRELTLGWPLEPFGPVAEVQEASDAEDAMIEALAGAEVLVTQMGPVTERVLAAGTDLKLVVVCRGGPVNVNLDAAKAHEAALLVEDRVARQRPMDVLIGSGANDHVGEGETGRQVEAQGLMILAALTMAGVDRQEVGELPAEQFLARAMEVVGELLRDVGEGAEMIGFPEPAAARAFEFVNEMKRLARLLVQHAAPAGRSDHAARVGKAIGDQRQRHEDQRGRENGIADHQRRGPSSDEGIGDRPDGRLDGDHGADDEADPDRLVRDLVVRHALIRMSDVDEQQPQHAGGPEEAADGLGDDVRFEIAADADQQREGAVDRHQQSEQQDRDQHLAEKAVANTLREEGNAPDEMAGGEKHGSMVEVRDTPLGEGEVVRIEDPFQVEHDKVAVTQAAFSSRPFLGHARDLSPTHLLPTTETRGRMMCAQGLTAGQNRRG